MTKKFIAAIALSIVWTACSKGSAGEEGKASVVFRAGISAVVTKTASTAPMAAGTQANILVFEKGADVAAAQMAVEGTATYTADVSGNLTGSPMVLDTRAYDFYSVSENTASAPALAFSQGKAPAANGTDYLWAKTSKNITVSDSQVLLTYTHSMVKITVEVVPEEGGGITLAPGKTKVTFTPSSDQGAVLNLADGTVEPSSALAGQLPMSMDGHSGSYIMVPLGEGNKMDFVLSLETSIAGGPALPVTYVSQVVAPSGGFRGGKEYRYTARVSQASVSFSGAQVTDWEVIDSDLPLE